MIKSANISDCGRYRFKLNRSWVDIFDARRSALWVMLNPSTADANVDDPTMRRVINFSSRDDFTSLTVINLCPYITANPANLKRRTHEELFPMGYFDEIRVKLGEYDTMICGWGSGAVSMLSRESLISSMSMIRAIALGFDKADVMCLGLSKQGHPRHPLYLKKNSNLVPFDLVGWAISHA